MGGGAHAALPLSPFASFAIANETGVPGCGGGKTERVFVNFPSFAPVSFGRHGAVRYGSTEPDEIGTMSKYCTSSTLPFLYQLPGLNCKSSCKEISSQLPLRYMRRPSRARYRCAEVPVLKAAWDFRFHTRLVSTFRWTERKPSLAESGNAGESQAKTRGSQ